MGEQADHELTPSAVVADALRTFPLAPVPSTLVPGVLLRLRALPAPARPRFRLGWFDWAISLFTTGMAGVGFLLWQSIPPPLMARLQVEWLLVIQRFTQLVPHLSALGS